MEPQIVRQIVVVGDKSSGKSTLVDRICTNTFSEAYNVTIGVDFKVLLKRYDESLVKFHFWDMAGSERYRALVSTYYRGAHGICLVYDASSRESLDGLRRWIKETDAAGERIPRFVVATKADAQDEASRDEGAALATSMGLHFRSCSAATGEGVQELLEVMHRALQPQPSLALTVLARAEDAGCRFSCLRVSGAEAGALLLPSDALARPCCELLPRLARACGLKSNEPAHFLTVGGRRLPEKPYEFEEDLVHVTVVLGKEHIENEEIGVKLLESVLAETGLESDDVQKDATIIGQDGRILPIDWRQWDDGCYPVKCTLSGKRRRYISIADVFEVKGVAQAASWAGRLLN